MVDNNMGILESRLLGKPSETEIKARAFNIAHAEEYLGVEEVKTCINKARRELTEKGEPDEQKP